jgi:membrane-bound metal-dependent hydrolase YbcI (DUF457 family)
VPFTPIHFGPGLLLKSAAPRHISLAAFATTQVAVDLEPLYFMMRGEYPVHRALHTVWGGGAVGLAVGLSLWVIARSRSAGFPPAAHAEVGRAPALLGGLIGGVSHVLLDSFMHRDVQALRPLAETQWVLDPAGVAALHVGCVLAGVLGAAALFVRRARS